MDQYRRISKSPVKNTSKERLEVYPSLLSWVISISAITFYFFLYIVGISFKMNIGPMSLVNSKRIYTTESNTIARMIGISSEFLFQCQDGRTSCLSIESSKFISSNSPIVFESCNVGDPLPNCSKNSLIIVANSRFLVGGKK